MADSPSRLRSLLLRVSARLLARGQGEVRAMEQVLHLKGVLRFAGLFLLTVVVPSVLLGYLGITSIRGEELAVLADVDRQAGTVADGFWTKTDRDFSAFELAVQDRLEAGRSPLEGPGELHRHLVVALRFDEEGTLVAPFQEERLGGAVFDRFEPAQAEAVDAERAGQDPATVARLYSQAARASNTRTGQGRALYDRARMLHESGRQRDAITQLQEVAAEFGAQRDAWGFRLADLARLEMAELALAEDRRAGANALRDLVESLLAARWTVGEGGEAAVARRALSLLEPIDDREWVAGARGRLAERTAALYWSGVLVPELHRIMDAQTSLRVDSGKLRWTTGDKALWATTWWGDDFYAFGLDLPAVLSELKADARGSVAPDSPVSAYLVGPDEDQPDALVRRRLAPWLSGWALAVAPRDPDALARQLARKRTRRIVVVALSVGTIAFGAVLTLLLVGRELDAARMKADFAASVSHELRSPITHIRLKGESLLYGLVDSEEDLEKAYHAIVRESERLSRLVDNVLDFAAIERGAKRYSLKPGDIADSVLRAIDMVSTSVELADRDLEIDLPPDLPVVYHDADAVAQCVVNLVSNAAKYSPPGGWIRVLGRVTVDAVEVCVSDQGIGIAPHDMRLIFQPFYRSRDALARRRKGTGIGLAITHYIMSAHGGSVTVASQPGKGSTFTMRFPLEPPAELIAGGSQPAPPPRRSA